MPLKEWWKSDIQKRKKLANNGPSLAGFTGAGDPQEPAGERPRGVHGGPARTTLHQYPDPGLHLVPDQEQEET